MNKQPKIVLHLFHTKRRQKQPVLKLSSGPATASLIDPSSRPMEEYQPELSEFELHGRFLSARKQANHKAFYLFNPLELCIEFFQDDRGSECEISINRYNEALMEQIVDRHCLRALKLDRTIQALFEQMILEEKLAVEFRQKNGIFQVNLIKKTWFVGFSNYFDQVFRFETFKELVMFNLVSGLIRPGNMGCLTFDLSNLRLLLCKLKNHIIEIYELLSAYKKLVGKEELSLHLDEKFLDKFALISKVYNTFIVIPMLQSELMLVGNPRLRIFHRLYSLLSVIGEVRYFEDLSNDKLIKILKKQSQGIEDDFFPLVEQFPTEMLVGIINQSLAFNFAPVLFSKMESQLSEKEQGLLPNWVHFCWLLIKQGDGLAMFFPSLHYMDHAEALFDLATMSTGAINPSVPARFRVDSKGVAAFFSSQGDWWTNNQDGTLLSHFERTHARIIKSVKFGPYVWSLILQDGRSLVQKHHLSEDASADSLDYMRDEVSITLLPGKIPDFGSKKLIFYVNDGVIHSFPNKAILSSEDMKTVSLRTLLSKPDNESRNSLVADRLRDSHGWYYDSYYYLSKSRLIARYVERQTVEDGCATIEDVIFCFKWYGGTDFEYKSRRVELLEYDRYYSKYHGKLAQFKFFSQRKKDYALTYSSLTGEFSLGCFSSFTYKTILPWGVHFPANLKIGNSPQSRRVEWFKKRNKETNLFYCMSWDNHEKTLRVAASWLKGPNPHLVVPHITTYSFRIN